MLSPMSWEIANTASAVAGFHAEDATAEHVPAHGLVLHPLVR